MIIIIGDSWGVGEWGLDKNEYCLIGPGIGQYLSLDHTVVNLSAGGASNTQAIDRLDLFLTRYTVDDGDTVYWIVSSPARGVDIKSIAQSELTIDQAIRKLLNTSMDRAELLGKQHNITINLIGGLCDLNTVDISQYQYLQVAVPSWGQLIDNEYQQSVHSYDIHWDLLGQELIDPIKKQEWLELTISCENKRKSMIKNFNTDQHHPDRYGHIKLRNHLYPDSRGKF